MTHPKSSAQYADDLLVLLGPKPGTPEFGDGEGFFGIYQLNLASNLGAGTEFLYNGHQLVEAIAAGKKRLTHTETEIFRHFRNWLHGMQKAEQYCANGSVDQALKPEKWLGLQRNQSLELMTTSDEIASDARVAYSDYTTGVEKLTKIISTLDIIGELLGVKRDTEREI